MCNHNIMQRISAIQFFKRSFVVNDRAIHVLIDDSSCNNLASEDIVQRLGLDTTTLPQPYAITWLNPGAKVQVTRMVRVPISIGSYHDHVDCDVVPMDVCSLLLVGYGFMILMHFIMVEQISIASCLR